MPAEFNAGSFNDLARKYLLMQMERKLQDLEKDYGLHAALSALVLQQADSGVIQDDRTKVERFRIPSLSGKWSFNVQYNPARAQRAVGFGRSTPPPGRRAVNNGCFLCTTNIDWRNPLQVYRRIELDGKVFVALVNPFPHQPNHITVASAKEIPQPWYEQTSLSDVLGAFISLADRLPSSWMTILNGAGAGATIPKHLHFQCFETAPFPMETVAADIPDGLVPDYPVTAVCVRGGAKELEEKVREIDRAWAAAGGSGATANLAARKNSDGRITVYFIPRDSGIRAPGFAGVAGTLEMLGEFVFPASDLIESGRIDAAYLERILKCCEAPGARELVSQMNF